jgi:hypothetical protein
MHRKAVCFFLKAIQHKGYICDEAVNIGILWFADLTAKMIEQLGGEVVKMIFLMELAGLNGRAKLQGYDVESVIIYEGK